MFLRPFGRYVRPVLVFHLCPSSARVAATFPGTILFPLLCSVFQFCPQYIYSFLYLVLLFQVSVSKISSVLFLNVVPLFSSVPKLHFLINKNNKNVSLQSEWFIDFFYYDLYLGKSEFDSLVVPYISVSLKITTETLLFIIPTFILRFSHFYPHYFNCWSALISASLSPPNHIFLSLATGVYSWAALSLYVRLHHVSTYPAQNMLPACFCYCAPEWGAPSVIVVYIRHA